MAVDFGIYRSVYPTIQYYYNFLNNLIVVSKLFKNSKDWVQILMKVNLTLNLRSNLFRIILRKKYGIKNQEEQIL